jgi:hypothetical protein
MGQHTSEFHQEQSGVVNQQVLDRVADTPTNVIAATAADFGGFEPFVNEEVIARFMLVKPRCVLEQARAGEIPAHPIGRGVRKKWRFRLSEIHAHFSAPANTTGATLKLAVPGATRRKQ